ncbi:MAG: orotate phosphoribosyltransferase [Lentisphaeria bacterium]|nr:orotate phosphoribosyltransferase [Lentisphaeria bacterium]
MTDQEIIAAFESAGALLTGHFQLRSKKHSNRFFQAALVFKKPWVGEELCKELAARIKAAGIEAETVISPAVGGLFVGQEIARALHIESIFADKENDQLVLKRGFRLKPGEKVIVAEDVVTEGGRVQQTIDLVRAHGADPVAVAVITDRSGGKVSFGGIPFFSLLKLSLPTYTAEECPMCRAGQPIDVPGSKS